ncbi:MAG: acyltransferase [Candidatus Helarchaeota archaeon]
MKIPKGLEDLIKYFPILKNSAFLQNYFISQFDAQTEKARNRIESYQKKLIRKLKKISLKSYAGTDTKLRKTREATEKEKKYYRKWTTGLIYPARLLLRIRALELGTPTFKANLLKDFGAKIGEGVLFTMGNFVDPLFTRLIEIGDKTIISLSAAILCHEFAGGERSIENLRVGKVSIGKNVFIAPGAVLLPGIRIDENSYVGPGFHSHNIPANHVAFGLPENMIHPFSESMMEMIEGERELEDLPAHVSEFREYIPIFKKGSYNIVTSILLELQKQKMPQAMRHFLLGLAGVKVDPRARIEDNVTLDPWHPERIKIGDGAHVKRHAVIITHEGLKDSPVRLGNVEIGKNALIEVGAGVLPGIKVGENAEILPYSAAVTDVEPNSQVVGMPAVKEGETFSIENFFAQHFSYSSNIWDEIQQFKKKEQQDRDQEEKK